RCDAAPPLSPSSAISRKITEWAATISPTATATSTTPCSPPSVTTSDASSAGSPLYSVSAWPSYSLKPLPCQPEKSILHPRLDKIHCASRGARVSRLLVLKRPDQPSSRHALIW